MFTLAYEQNEVKYKWTNEADSMFAKEVSLVEVPYVESSFLESLNIKSMIPRSHDIRMNDMNNITCYMNYDMSYVYAVVCCVQNVNYDDSCYSHGITFLIQIWKANNLSLSKYGKLTHFPNLHLASPVTWPSTIMLLGKRYSYSCMSLACACIYPYLVQVCTNPIHLYYFRCRQRWVMEL